jgi:drug/metabolite transporter (DMT)-like permease
MKQRDIAIAVILTIVTCGIYGIYWLIVLTDEIGEVSGDRSISGVMAFLLTMVTCGIYGYYWAYKMGQQLTAAKQARGMIVSSTELSVLYLILQLFGLSIVNYCLMQNELNTMV